MDAHDLAHLLVVSIPIVAIVSALVIRPWIRLHYNSRSTLSTDERQELVELRNAADRMETRLSTLEQILDAEAPGWRERA